jgi:hypothetical protein
MVAKYNSAPEANYWPKLSMTVVESGEIYSLSLKTLKPSFCYSMKMMKYI